MSLISPAGRVSDEANGLLLNTELTRTSAGWKVNKLLGRASCHSNQKGSAVRIDARQSIYGDAGSPLNYPSVRPDHPYLLNGSSAHRLSWSWDQRGGVLEDGRALEVVLEGLGVAPVQDRVVQIAFGANRDLENLAWKLSRYNEDPGGRTSPVVITLPGVVRDADVVACNIGYWGYVYAALALHRPPELIRPYLIGSLTPVTVLLLDEGQMVAMHLSEGVPKPAEADRDLVSCDVGTIEVDVMGKELQAQVYGLPLPFLSLDGGRLPVAFRAVRTDSPRGALARLSQEELWEAIADNLADRVHSVARMVTAGEIVEIIRAGADAHASGERDSSSSGRALHETIRTGIIDSLATVDTDGMPATGSKSLPGVENRDLRWSFGPTLRDQLNQHS